MSAARTVLLGRAMLAALVLASLTFGAAQALAGGPQNGCGSSGTCSTRPYNQACADRCLEAFPDFGGQHRCFPDPTTPGTYCCTCVF